MNKCLFGLAQILLLMVKYLSTQRDSNIEEQHLQCHCMEYWQCVGEGGKPYSYCSYSHKVCCFIDPFAEKIGILPKRQKHNSCGRKGTDNNKDGVSESGEWAWHAAILEKPRDLYVCGASLLDEFWILTAAHCVDDYDTPRSLKVRLGEHDVSNQREPHPHEEFDVARVIIHSQFDNETLENDIALLRLSTPARRRPHINIVCIQESPNFEAELISSSSCYITGWGRRTENSSHSLVLKEVNVPLWRHERCEAALQLQFGTEYVLPKTSLCGGAPGRDACDGDGGGPLVCEKKSMWYQVGIVSFGIGCGRRNTPGVYTRVLSFAPWIHDIVLRYKS